MTPARSLVQASARVKMPAATISREQGWLPRSLDRSVQKPGFLLPTSLSRLDERLRIRNILLAPIYFANA